MRKTIVIAALLGAAPVLAQTTAPMGGRTPAAIHDGLLACLRIADGTSGRLSCYDTLIASTPKDRPPSARDVASCRFYTEQDERLSCFNDFAESIPR